MKNLVLKALILLAATIFMSIPAFSQREAQTPGLRRMPRGLTQAKIREHVIAPAHTRDVEMEIDEANELSYSLSKKPRAQFKAKPKLNGEEFVADLHSILATLTAGYIMQVRHNGNTISTTGNGWAQTPQNLSLGWTENTRMHIASISKFLTAVALVKLLDSKGISYDAKIAEHLPAYWRKGANVDKITFRHLLTHRSGFGSLPPGSGESSASDYAFMKSKVSLGVVSPGGEFIYQNMNYGLMRILIPIINGDMTRDFEPPANVRDQAWDIHTISFYKEYMQDKIFTPAGVANAGFAPLPSAVNSALAYSFPPGNGWNSGDLQTVAGGAGWRLSIKELLDVMNHFRRKNTIIDSQKAQYMLDNSFGINGSKSTPAGTMYFRKGRWRGNGKTEQCVAFFLPDNLEVVVLVNSPIGPSGFSLRKLVGDVYENSLRD